MNSDTIDAPIEHPTLVEAAQALHDGQPDRAQALLRPFLAENPNDLASLRLMAAASARLGLEREAEALLDRALAIAPGFVAARFDLAQLLHRDRPGDVVGHVEQILKVHPGEPNLLRLLALMLERVGRYEEAAAIFGELAAGQPDDPRLWIGHGHLLRTIGKSEESIAAYRRALALAPRSGEAWWSIADLKTGALTDDDVTAIYAALADTGSGSSDRSALNFALGRALEERGQAEQAFALYSEGNRLRRETLDYNSAEISSFVDRAEILFTPAFFEARTGGSDAADPIFVIGMPRSGSTLVDQILSGNRLVEGTAELPDLMLIAQRLRVEHEDKGLSYPELLADLDANRRAALGEEYLDRTRARRRTDRPFFIDKTPNNWAHVGLIQLILPKARIVDVRRHPLACCLSNFRQMFAEGQEFSYSLADVGRYYSDYARMTRHFDAVLPGRIVRVCYEDLVADMEAEVRRLVAALGLEFDPEMLRFHESDRAVYTASSEQVRQPLNTAGLDAWQAYDRWLGPLREALGPELVEGEVAPA